MSDIKPPPEVFTLPVVLCPSCGHGIRTKGSCDYCHSPAPLTPTHDSLCPATIADGRWRARCECDLIQRVVDREAGKWYAKALEVRKATNAMFARDEAVAAKLVEVICDRESDYRNALWELGVAHDMHDAVTDVLNATRADMERVQVERDAARAEVERLRSPEWEAEVRADERAKVYRPDAHRMMLERDAARAERLEALQKVAALDDQLAAARAEVLADLRAEVEGLRRTTEVMWDGDYVTSVQLRDVLALLDEEEVPHG